LVTWQLKSLENDEELPLIVDSKNIAARFDKILPDFPPTIDNNPNFDKMLVVYTGNNCCRRLTSQSTGLIDRYVQSRNFHCRERNMVQFSSSVVFVKPVLNLFSTL
jgi:hypothetical protein